MGSVREFQFHPPPECPVFEPTTEEFQNPLSYINKIRPKAEQSGICKIRPPQDWQPPFTVDVENLRFTPRIQRLNELEACTRVKLNFLDQIAKFWELQGNTLKIPVIERKAIDLYTLYNYVKREGGMDNVNQDKNWNRIAAFMGYPASKNIGMLLKANYERILFPYELFQEGKNLPEDLKSELNGEEEEEEDIVDMEMIPDVDKDYIPHEIPSRQAIKPPDDRHNRRSKRYVHSDIQEIKNYKEALEITGNKELRRLKFYGAGPKMPGLSELSKSEELITKKGGRMLPTDDPLAKYVCRKCARGDDEERMLLCDGCDDSFHTFCLVPPLPDIPKGDWRCPRCIAEEVSKPQEAFGFEQAQKEYSLQTFGEMADQFKSDYFNMPVHLVPSEVVEKEFWRIMSSIDEDVVVEYGADLHTMDHGSGFPTKNCRDLQPPDEEYRTSGWNLNNLPVLPASVLGYLNQDVSGMIVPWMYVGMCFSTFCWHVEDHWSYSINYLHWGEPKTWYGVPGAKAPDLEAAMKKNATELFESQPDLMHQLVTILNPNNLMANGVPVYRTDQQAGEFVITFPRSYHAGFNQGYNFAEAVNFAPADWVKVGRQCVEHYSDLRRYCVFSHDELVCKMATDAESLTAIIADAALADMRGMVAEEKVLRKKIHNWGVTVAEREAFELIPDDSRQCDFCKTTLFMSALTCKCTQRLVCLKHYKNLCECPAKLHTLRYRYTLKELPSMLNRLRVRAEAFDAWLKSVKEVMEATGDDRVELAELKELIDEAFQKKFPDTELLTNLQNAYDKSEKCAAIAQQLVMVGVRTRTRLGGDGKSCLTVDEVRLFNDQLERLPVRVPDAPVIETLLKSCIEFQKKANKVLAEEEAKYEEVRDCLNLGTSLDIELPELPKIKQKYEQTKWLFDTQELLDSGDVTLEDLEKYLDMAIAVPPCPPVESMRSELQALLLKGRTAEDKSKLYLQSKCKSSLDDIKVILDEVKGMPLSLTNLNILKDAYDKSVEWKENLEKSYKLPQHPFLENLQKLFNTAVSLPVDIPQLNSLENSINAACAWKEKIIRTFAKKNSHFSLMEILMPRCDVDESPMRYRRRRPREEASSLKKMEQVLKIQPRQDICTQTVVKAYKVAEDKEINAMRHLRLKNLQKRATERSSGKYCICSKGLQSNMMQCELCKDFFHTGCVPVPRYNPLKAGPGKGGIGGEAKFLCPCCCRSRRPRMETILALLVSMGKLNVRLPEGEALQCLAERAMGWQERARNLISTDEMSQAWGKLSHMSQKLAEAAQKEKAEKIVSSEVSKAGKLDGNIPAAPIDIPSVEAVMNSPVQSEDSSDFEKTMGNSLMEQTAVAALGSISNGEQATALGAVSNVDQTPAPTLGSVSSYSSSEHAYSSASKPGGPSSGSTRKHARKSPLVPRSLEPSRLSLSDTTMAQLEELMMEADLLELSLDENTHIWRILLATRPPPIQEDIAQDFQDMDEFSNDADDVSDKEKPKEKKRKIEDTPVNGVSNKKNRSRTNSRDSSGSRERIPREATKSMLSSSLFKPKQTNKEAAKPTLKRKVQSEKSVDADKRSRPPPKRVKKRVLPQSMPNPRSVDSNKESEEESEDECASPMCRRPTGSSVDWVQCDGTCAQWFHMACVGIRKADVSAEEDYICPQCKYVNTDDEDSLDKDEDELESMGRENGSLR